MAELSTCEKCAQLWNRAMAISDRLDVRPIQLLLDVKSLSELYAHHSSYSDMDDLKRTWRGIPIKVVSTFLPVECPVAPLDMSEIATEMVEHAACVSLLVRFENNGREVYLDDPDNHEKWSTDLS